MNKFILLLISFFILLYACKQQASTDPGIVVPKALEPKSEYGRLFSSGRSGSNIVQELYKELVEKDTVLQNFEQRVVWFDKMKTDSGALLKNYFQQNKYYYDQVQLDTRQIKDSLLRYQLTLMINQSFARHQQNFKTPLQLAEQIDERYTTLEDLHLALKLVMTLPVIEKYQKQAMPGLSPLEAVLKELNKTIAQADTLIKQ